MADNKIIQEALEREKLLVIGALKKELEFQKHIGKGTLRDGFYHKIVSTPDNIFLYIMNDTPYMWLVNDGKSTGVNASFNAIYNWAQEKWRNGELDFSSEGEISNFVSKVKNELENSYYTAGGKLVAERRYFFIDFARESWKKGGAIKRIEDSIVKDVQDIVNKELVKKEIKLTIG
tara:strand:+ start:4248 stop:4775 length:528 start_codon:yes stop_codon:yes gene_type:complete